MASNEQIKPLPSSSNKLTHHFERSRCVSLNDRRVCCGDVVVKCVQRIQRTSVGHRATAAEMTHVCQTDFMSLHIIVVQTNVQVYSDTNSETCKITSQKTFSISGSQDIRTLAC